MAQYKNKEFGVRRRFQEFVWLHRTLQIRYRDIVMPSLPPAKYSGRFDPAFIEERKTALEDFTNWWAKSPSLIFSSRMTQICVFPLLSLCPLGSPSIQ